MRDDDGTLEELYRRHAPSVFRRARALLGNEAEAQEIVQDVFLSLFERPEQYAGKSALTTFLYSASTHACLNRIRDQRNRSRLLQERHLQSEAGEDKLALDQLLLLHRTLERMPASLAQVAIYYYVDDLSHDEIARLVGCSRRQIGNLLERVRKWAQNEEAARAGEAT